MSSLPCGCRDSCPSAPEITLNQTIIEMDGDTAFFRDEYFTTAGNVHVLAYTPYEAASVLVSRNSGVQRQPTDFIVQGNSIVLAAPLIAGEVLHVRYFATTGVSTLSGSSFPLGSIIGFGGATAPTGWLWMDGTTSYEVSLYSSFVTLATANSWLLSNNGTNFVIKARSVSYYDSATSTFVTDPAIVKAV